MTDTENFAEWLSKTRVNCGFKTQKELADRAGISRATVSRIEAGIQHPDPDTLRTLAWALDRSYGELMAKAGYLEGIPDKEYVIAALDERDRLNTTFERILELITVGDNFEEGALGSIEQLLDRVLPGVNWDKTPQDFKRLVTREIHDIDMERALVQDLLRMYRRSLSIGWGNVYKEPDVDRTEKSSIVALPVVGRVSCGKGYLALEDIEKYEPTPRNWLNGGEYFYLRAKGDSMIGARIQEGDLLLIRQQEDVEDGEIAVVLIDDEAVLKRVFKRGDALWLQSENPKYPPIVLQPESDFGVRIIGKLKKIVVNV